MAAKDMVVCARWSPVVIAGPRAEGEMGVGGVTETPPWAWGGVGRCRLRAWEQCGAVDRKGR